MRIAFLLLAVGACSDKSASKVTATVQEVRSRMKVPCEDRGSLGIVSCGEITGPLYANIFYDRAETAERARATRIDITIEAASAKAALSQLHALLDGIVPADHFEGMSTRFSGASAEKFTLAKPVTVDGVEVLSGTWSVDRAQPTFKVQITYD